MFAKRYFGTRTDLKSNYKDFGEESWLGKSLQEFKSHFDYDLRDSEFCWKTFRLEKVRQRPEIYRTKVIIAEKKCGSVDFSARWFAFNVSGGDFAELALTLLFLG